MALFYCFSLWSIRSYNSLYFISNNNDKVIEMETDFECIKIKDGLYLANSVTAQDYEFLQINKFAFVVNCSAQSPNSFDNNGIKYLKFKLIKEKAHKLWDENLKKLRKLQKFIDECEEHSMCCLIFSANGNNRSLVMLTAYLMSKYRWKLGKTLQYIRSKDIFIGLSEHYIGQLEILEGLLSGEAEKPALSGDWRGPYANEEEQLISKTFLNSQQIVVIKQETKVQKQPKRVMWQDKIDKERKKETKEIKLKQQTMLVNNQNSISIAEKKKNGKTSAKLIESQAMGVASYLHRKAIKVDLMDEPLKKIDNGKKVKRHIKNVSLNKMDKKKCEDDQDLEDEFVEEDKKIYVNSDKKADKDININENIAQNPHFFDEKELIKLIKKNLKVKKVQKNVEIEEIGQSNSTDQQNSEDYLKPQKEVYRLTINNFIQPNINFVNSSNQDGNVQKNPVSKPPNPKTKQNKKEEDKYNRTQSDKQGNVKSYNDILKIKLEKGTKPGKRNTEHSPKARQRKLQKALSLQFRKNK